MEVAPSGGRERTTLAFFARVGFPNAATNALATVRPPHSHQPPGLPILPQPPAPTIPMQAKLRRLPPVNRFHRNHKPRIARHHISHYKINLRSIVRHHLPISVSLQVHQVGSILPGAGRLYLHSPQPLSHIQNKVIALLLSPYGLAVANPFCAAFTIYLISDSSPRCLLVSSAVEGAPSPAAFDFALDSAAHPRFSTPIRIPRPHFSHCSDNPGSCACATDTPVRRR